MDFVISSSDEFKDVDLASDDVLFNIVTAETALKRNDGDKFWRGPKEKAVSLLQLLITGLSPPGGIICDLTAGTGMIHFFIHSHFFRLRQLNHMSLIHFFRVCRCISSCSTIL